MPNRLAAESSPYLLQHAQNPVDWYPWGDEALTRARNEQKPILVSIGYAACHWCHVMEHESFESERVAAVMNELFVCIKVDREERPDVDTIYMDAVQAMGVRGGWPLNVFLTPDARPFYGLTYAPQEKWLSLLHSVDRAWRENREKLEESADQFTAALRADELQKYGLGQPVPGALAAAALDQAFFHFQEGFDRERGGMNRAPKFPMPAHYAWLLRYHVRTGNALALDHARHTLREMARGGIYDQVGGGWARYSVDAEWFAPHFEKMLYDNGQLLTACAEAYQLTEDWELRDAALRTVAWLGREMMAESGGAYASLDADSEGEEGRFYVFSWNELRGALGDDNLPLAAAYYRCLPPGNWEHGHNILHRQGADEQFAEAHGLTPDDLRQRAAGWRADLLHWREQRPRPGLDDKLLTGWNGLLLRGLCDAHRAFGDAESLALAQEVGAFLVDSLALTGDSRFPLLRNLKEGSTPQPGFLEDYAAVVSGLASLYEVTFEEHWLLAADGLLTYALTHFADPAEPEGLLFYTDGQTAQPLIARKKELFDNVIPASNSLLSRALRQMGLLLGRPEYGARARGLLARVRPLVEKEPGFLANWAALYEELLTEGAEIAIVGPEADAFRREIGRHFLPGAVLCGTTGTSELPLLRGRLAVEGRTSIYVCFEGACQRPVFSVEEALDVLRTSVRRSAAD